tara:strand:+ start:77836 stop:78198 length:363 start_codon:yes stop_codon:yes gene_type:complete
MIFAIIFLSITIFLIFSLYIKKKHLIREGSLLNRFKRKFKNRNRLREKLSENFSSSLMSDPEFNITISAWNNEEELREKADIHRARLSKYGRSRMNGEMLFLGPKGGVFKYNLDGKKKYL